jgi:hypothetical protein
MRTLQILPTTADRALNKPLNTAVLERVESKTGASGPAGGRSIGQARLLRCVRVQCSVRRSGTHRAWTASKAVNIEAAERSATRRFRRDHNSSEHVRS